jgi:CheY-like chemotaxis protein
MSFEGRGLKMTTKTVLIVDDSESMRQIVRRVLKPLDVAILEGCQAKEGMQILLQESVDLLITDWNMLEVDGLEFTRILRSLPQFEQLPILMLSNHSSEATRLEALQGGIDIFVSKFAPIEEWRDGVTWLLTGPRREHGSHAGAPRSGRGA